MASCPHARKSFCVRLPVKERADPAAELLASLDDAATEDPAEVEAAWAAETERRARRVMTGETPGTS